MTRLTRILMFPFFFSQHHWISSPYIEVPSKMPRELPWKLVGGYTPLTGQST
jgi:hypothetical protein